MELYEIIRYGRKPLEEEPSTDYSQERGKSCPCPFCNGTGRMDG